jgi:hypothetical protein
MSSASVSRKSHRDRVLPPLNNTRGRRTGWNPPAWGSVPLDECGVEDMGAFFEEIREQKFVFRVIRRVRVKRLSFSSGSGE